MKKRKNIHNTYYIIRNTQLGFTLVEILVVMLVFAVVSGISGAILVTSLRTSNKTNTLNNVKQNGDVTLFQITKLIRTSRALTSPFPCVTPVSQKSLVLTGSDGGQIVYSCNDSVSDQKPYVIASNGASLIDTNSVQLVGDTCFFTCSQNTSSDYPVINISFSLSQKSVSTLVDQTASATPINFSTSVVIRNLNR